MTDPAKGGKVMIEVTQDDLVKRIEYILDPSASATERMHRRVHLTNHDLRECIKALRDTARIEALEAEVERFRGEYICKCGLRVEPHRCRDTQGEF